MAWYAAHLIEYYTVATGDQARYLCHEAVVLIVAEDEDGAYLEAERLGRVHAENAGEFAWEETGYPVRAVFAGVRKLVACPPPPSVPYPPSGLPAVASGSETTHSWFVVEGQDAIVALTNGDPVRVIYQR